jgi:UDPglucose 6-dehydrogenase
MRIGFIGQGFVGRNIANDFESRGFQVVRYALEPEYVGNLDLIRSCDVTFIAVPTPTTPHGFDYSIVENSLSLIGVGKVAVIKSTVLPGTTKKLQEKYPHIVILFSPEFLCESTAARDASHPMFNVIGMPSDSSGHRTVADTVMRMLPKSDQSHIIPSDAAELFKYAHNIHGYVRVVFANLLYDLSSKLEIAWPHVEQVMNIDPMMSPYYNSPVHKSGRGAGGNCFVKDMAAFAKLYEQTVPQDALGVAVLRSIEEKNLELLRTTNKSQDLVRGVYGEREIRGPFGV